MNLKFRIVLLAALLPFVLSVDHSKFKTCEQSSFCRRLRSMEEGSGKKWEVDSHSAVVSDNGLSVDMVNGDSGVRLRLQITGLIDGSAMRLRIYEANPLRQRFTPNEIFANGSEPHLSPIKVEMGEQKSGGVGVIEVSDAAGKWRAAISVNPFRVDVFTPEGGQSTPVFSFNSRGLFAFEETRKKPPGEDEEGQEVLRKEQEAGLWEENFSSHHDSKPFGPTAVSADLFFPQAKVAYGLPEHASSLALKNTRGKEPYRLYNLDVFEYELDSEMALYAAIPVVYGLGSFATVGALWINPSETWIDVSTSASEGTLSSLFSSQDGVETRFMSESGNVDVVLFVGPSLMQATRQYVDLTGHPPIPPLFSLGYHQCRWNYISQEDVNEVHHNFDVHDIPMDAMWLDIEHTDGKKYFTWDPFKFSDPIGMQRNLSAFGRKLVVIVDPHIKREGGYFLHDEATNQGLYVKNSDNTDYEGWCWPGSSSYLDLASTEVRDKYSELYSLERYKGSTVDLHLWNDMNEPSVFNGPEVTMPKDKLHDSGKWEHREVHNMYGLYQVMGTYWGLVRRTGPASPESSRPFILTRSAFSGSQRYAAIWTGDNAADWKHLAASVPMCLSLALGGLSFCGADVGGFFGNPDRELLIRWYQLGSYLPFFRAHAHIDTRRREPWLFGDEATNAIRSAIKQRYSHLPYYYTLFYHLNKTGDPVIRPLSMEFPEDANTYQIDDQFMIGKWLMYKPVVEPGMVSNIKIYFPMGNWFYGPNLQPAIHSYGQHVPADCSLQTGCPHWYRGGGIVPKKVRVRRSSPLMANDPYTLLVAPDEEGKAVGDLYIDDGESHRYIGDRNAYLHVEFTFSKMNLTSRPRGGFNTGSILEKVVIGGLKPDMASSAILETGGTTTQIPLIFNVDSKSATIRKPGVNIGKPFVIMLV